MIIAGRGASAIIVPIPRLRLGRQTAELNVRWLKKQPRVENNNVLMIDVRTL
jgi:hypothetical protein